MPRLINIPGVLLAINDIGVLIVGASGIGKSELALGLIARNHRLIADDSVILTQAGKDLIGTCPPLLQGFLAIRDLGIINVGKLFGEKAIDSHVTVQLVIELVLGNNPLETEPLQGRQYMQSWLNIQMPVQPLRVTPGRDLPLLVEVIIRHHCLQKAGYSASADLITQHQLSLDYESV